METMKIAKEPGVRSYFRRSGFDRRGGEERRQVYDLGYFLDQSRPERRRRDERRQSSEMRADWVRVTASSSICIRESVSQPARSLTR